MRNSQETFLGEVLPLTCGCYHGISMQLPIAFSPPVPLTPTHWKHEVLARAPWSSTVGWSSMCHVLKFSDSLTPFTCSPAHSAQGVMLCQWFTASLSRQWVRQDSFLANSFLVDSYHFFNPFSKKGIGPHGSEKDWVSKGIKQRLFCKLGDQHSPAEERKGKESERQKTKRFFQKAGTVSELAQVSPWTWAVAAGAAGELQCCQKGGSWHHPDWGTSALPSFCRDAVTQTLQLSTKGESSCCQAV